MKKKKKKERKNPLGNDEKVLISFPAASCLIKFLIKFHFCLISIVEIVKKLGGNGQPVEW